MATGVYLRRNDAFLSGCLYLFAGAVGAPVFAEGGSELFSSGKLIASGGYLLAFPIASALVAEGLDRSPLCWCGESESPTDMLVFGNDSRVCIWDSMASRVIFR